MLRVTTLISGRGSNLAALLTAQAAGELPVEFSAVISNRADAAGIETARARAIAVRVVPHSEYATREAFEAALKLEPHFKPARKNLGAAQALIATGTRGPGPRASKFLDPQKMNLTIFV